MKNGISLSLITSSLLFSQSFSAFGNEKTLLKLDEAIGLGLGEAPSIKKANARQDEMLWKKVEARAELLPKVNFGASHAFDLRYQTVPVTIGNQAASFPITYPRTAYGGEANWMLFNGFSNWNNYQAARLDAVASDSDSSRKQFETKKEIELAYYNILASVKLAEVAHQNVKTLKESNERATIRFKNGAATNYEVLRVQVQLSEAEAEVEKAEDNIVITKKNLLRVMGKRDLDFETSGELPEPTLSEIISTIDEKDFSTRDDIKAALYREQAADKRRLAGMGTWSPSVSLFGRYDRYDNTTSNLDYNAKTFRDSYAVGVYLKWSLFDGGATYAKPFIAKAQSQTAEATFQEAVLQSPADFELWKRRYLYSARFYESRKADVKRSTESLRIASSAFNQGSKTINDVLVAEADLFKARAGVVKAQMDAQEALTKLELTLGREIQ
jgi:outer membrane protein TolC